MTRSDTEYDPTQRVGPRYSAAATSVTSAPLVSVVIPTHNAASYLPQAIDSVLQQSYSNIEIIVVDDGSVDETSQIVQQYGDAISYQKLEYQGQAMSRNVGIQLSTGSFLQFLDADDVLLPHKVAQQVGFLQQHADVDIVFGETRAFTDAAPERLFPVLKQRRTNDILDALLYGGVMTIHSALSRRSCIEALRGFDETLDMRVDWDLWIRAAALGYRFHALQEVCVLYRKRHGSLTTHALQQCASRLRIVEKCESLLSPQRYRQLKVDRRVAYYRYKLGRAYLMAGERSRGRELMLEAWKARVWSPRIWLYYMASWCPDWVIGVCRACGSWIERPFDRFKPYQD